MTVFESLGDEEFNYLADEKGQLAHIVNECCKESIDGKWLVIEETATSILIEVRYLERLERDELCNKVFTYVDITQGAAQRVRRLGILNQTLRIEVKWTIPDSVISRIPDLPHLEDRR